MPSEGLFHVFISYSHSNTEGCEALRRHLDPLGQEGRIELWWDGRIGGGEEFDPRIWDKLNVADLVLLLVSSHHLASPSCRKETARAWERHQANSARVVPIILEPCDWKNLPLARLQAFPKDGKPVSDYGRPETAFAEIALGVRHLVTRMAEPVPTRGLIVADAPPPDQEPPRARCQLSGLLQDLALRAENAALFKANRKSSQAWFVEVFQALDQVPGLADRFLELTYTKATRAQLLNHSAGLEIYLIGPAIRTLRGSELLRGTNPSNPHIADGS